MSDFIDNNNVSEVYPVEDISPGDEVFSSVFSNTSSETADSAASEIAEDPLADESTSEDPPGETSNPPTVIERGQLQIIMMSPDGTMTVYDEAGNITAEIVDNAYSLWLSENGALDKPFSNYSVSEALLLFIAIGAVVGLICKVFKRRKL